jgi:hypothetical protein
MTSELFIYKEATRSDCMRSGIHEHDFLPMGADSPFIQCRTCDTAYCILCGESMTTIDTRRDHGFGKCSKYHQVIPGYEEGKEKFQQD